MLEVRPLAPGDWPLLKALRLEALADAPKAFRTTLAQAQAWTDAEWRARARRFGELPPATAFVSFVEGLPCGLLTCYLSESDGPGGLVGGLNAFWVSPAHRGQGLGEALIEAVLDWAARLGVGEVQAWVMADGDRAVGFYKKIGFRETGGRQPLTLGSPRDIVLLTRRVMGGIETL